MIDQQFSPPSGTLVARQFGGLMNPAGWQEQAVHLVATCGFLLLRGDRAGASQQSILLAALRERPTLHHYDPEDVDYWVTEQGRGRHARIDRLTPVREEAKYSWGRIQLVDRLGVRNEFLTFGGAVRTRVTADGTLLVAFMSPAPILRLAGHSQGFDPLSPEVGSFFGRLKIPIDFVPGAESRIASASPVVLYTGFVRDLRHRFDASEALRNAHPDVACWARREAGRLESGAPDAWKDAGTLTADLGIA